MGAGRPGRCRPGRSRSRRDDPAVPPDRQRTGLRTGPDRGRSRGRAAERGARRQALGPGCIRPLEVGHRAGALAGRAGAVGYATAMDHPAPTRLHAELAGGRRRVRARGGPHLLADRRRARAVHRHAGHRGGGSGGAASARGARGQEVRPTGGTAVGFADLAAVLSEATGRKITYRPISMEEARVRLAARGVAAPAIDATLAIAAYQRDRGPTATVSPAVQRLLGRAPRTIRDFARDYAASFR